MHIQITCLSCKTTVNITIVSDTLHLPLVRIELSAIFFIPDFSNVYFKLAQELLGGTLVHGVRGPNEDGSLSKQG